MICENITVGEGSEYPLKGLLTLPDSCKEEGAAPVPAVVMVHGSGPSDMDERVMKLTPFKDLAEGLVKHGIASVRYDKRTFAHARKLKKAGGAALTVKEETIDDALLAIELAKADPRIDSERVFILGHSMGAMLAPRIDAEGGDVCGLVLMAGTPKRLEEIVVRQLNQTANGKGPMKWFFKLWRNMNVGKFDGLSEMGDEEAKRKKFAGNITLYYFKEMGRRTASDYLLESDKPALIMQGERDYQVLAKEDFAAFEEQLAGRANTFFKLYPGLDHCFVEALYDDILKGSKEFGVERHIGEEVIGDIAAFIHDGLFAQLTGESAPSH